MYRLIVLVNYIRARVRNGDSVPAIRDSLTEGADFWTDEAYLKPVIPQDPLLQHLDALADDGESEAEEDAAGAAVASAPAGEADATGVVAELKAQLAAAQRVIASLTGDGAESPAAAGAARRPAPRALEDIDASYFDSYSHWGIHAVMLEDRVRRTAPHRSEGGGRSTRPLSHSSPAGADRVLPQGAGGHWRVSRPQGA